MLNGKRIVVVFPAYNAELTLEQTYHELDMEVIDEVILVDDASKDKTAALAQRLGIMTIIHAGNLGYGANQKTCYRHALARGAEVVVMVHPDYQYSPKLVSALAGMVISGHYDIALGSRIIGNTTRRGGMPIYKYISNRLLTFIENILLGTKLTEYHTGLRAFSNDVLTSLPLDDYDDDFVFDNQILAQAGYFGWRIGEISCPTRYFVEASSIGFARACVYGIGVLKTSLLGFLARIGLHYSRIFPKRTASNIRQV